MRQHTRHIHFIGICGVAMSALAIAFHRRGYKVTGSDKGFYPPVSTNLEREGIDFYPGWHPEKIRTPDLVVVGNVAGSTNPEWLHVQEQNIEYKSYPEVIRDFFIADNSIVCAGTFGKTTSTTLLSWVFSEAGLDPNYMFGGISGNDMPPAHLGKTNKYSIVEGDEYKSSRWDNRAKFFHYSPTHLLLTAVVWDHADVYPTIESYIDAFQKIVLSVPDSGVLVMSERVTNLPQLPKCQILRYGSGTQADYRYTNVTATKGGITFTLTHGDESYDVSSSMLGDFSADNLTACFAIARSVGVDAETILKAFTTFKGIKRRLERRHSGDIDVYDDIAHSPKKASATLATLRNLYKGKVIAIFEPNTGNRTSESFPGYEHAFTDADEVLIPRLSRVKIAKGDTDPPVDGEVLASIIAKSHNAVHYMPDDAALIEYLVGTVQSGDCIVFLGSHGFRNMIEEISDILS